MGIFYPEYLVLYKNWSAFGTKKKGWHPVWGSQPESLPRGGYGT
jgi:hypothetical protein